MRISDWSSDVCSSDLDTRRCPDGSVNRRCHEAAWGKKHFEPAWENKALRLLPVSEPALDPWLWLARRQSDRLDLAELARAHDEVAQLVDALGHDGCTDRKSVVEGKSGSVRVELGGRRFLKKKKLQHLQI